MPKQLRHDILEAYDMPMPASYWQRQKKFSVNLNESAFATDRQLEDQRFLRDANRNPQAGVLLKCDKVKSEKTAPTLHVDPLKVKAKVINKVVREASGVYNYTIVAPIRSDAQKKRNDNSNLDPDTNPLVAAYRKESNSKPVIMSFGHRPRSASRTFNPGTMKIRLKHGEVVASAPGKSGFGLSVAVLQQLLKAPKLPRQGELEASNPLSRLQLQPLESSGLSNSGILISRGDFDFSTSDLDNAALLRSRSGEQNSSQQLSPDTQEKDDWLSQNTRSIAAPNRMRKTKGKNKPRFKQALCQEIPWDESFRQIKAKDMKEKKSDKLNEIAEMSILERLQRFNKKAAVIEPSSGCCENKQRL